MVNMGVFFYLFSYSISESRLLGDIWGGLSSPLFIVTREIYVSPIKENKV
ncbi:MAG: hypothetical protein MGG37_15200 [Trichodesmium sp. MAG_R01]|nr:hypothetical protein [Trichodesmium sp. MAG_R01]